MQAAVRAGVPGQEATLWAQAQLGALYFNSGDLARAEETYRSPPELQPNYAYAVAGLARVQATQGDPQAAIAAYRGLVERLPLPEFVIPLGELYEVTGQPELAAQQYELVRVIQQLNTSADLDVDLELAPFEAEHGHDPAAARRQRAVHYFGWGRPHRPGAGPTRDTDDLAKCLQLGGAFCHLAAQAKPT